jgi:ABC-2 type transport system permease protein
VVALVAKQLTYLAITLLQAIVIFLIGFWLFPAMGLPKLNLPSDLGAVCIVSVICGACAISYATCVGVFANTIEQANGFGAISVVLLAALGGILVPAFAMPAGMQTAMKFSPMHWCLEAFYGLFLEAGTLKDILKSLAPLLLFIVAFQVLSLWRLKQKHLV